MDLVAATTELQKLKDEEQELSLATVMTPEFAEAYSLMKETVDQLSAIKATVDKKLKKVMRDRYMVDGSTKLELSTCKVTFIPGTVCKKFSQTKFKADHPDIYDSYLEESLREDSLRITANKEEQK